MAFILNFFLLLKHAVISLVFLSWSNIFSLLLHPVYKILADLCRQEFVIRGISVDVLLLDSVSKCLLQIVLDKLPPDCEFESVGEFPYCTVLS